MTVDVYKWLNKEPNHTFTGWRMRIPQKTEDGRPALPTNREEVRTYYLTEKYGLRWRKKTLKSFDITSVELDDSAWLKAVLFNPSSRLARQVACNIVELMCNSIERKQEVFTVNILFM